MSGGLAAGEREREGGTKIERKRKKSEKRDKRESTRERETGKKGHESQDNQ